MNERPTARAMMIPIAFVEFIPFLPSNQKIKAVKIAGSKRGKIWFKTVSYTHLTLPTKA